MADQSLRSGYEQTRVRQPIRSGRRSSTAVAAETPANSNERRRGFIASLDKPLVVIVLLLLSIGSIMIYSTTFDWSFDEYGSPMAIFLQGHVRNLVVGLVALVFFAFIDYRFWRRFAVLTLFVTIGALIAVLAFGDDTFGARRALVNGSFQPGELAEFTIVFYMAAWLGSKNTRIQSFTYGLIPFFVLVGIFSFLLIMQPDVSSAVIIVMTSGVMFFLAGASVLQLGLVAGIASGAGLVLVNVLNFSYIWDRIASYGSSLGDLTQANWHTQQAITAFLNGGWLGVGLGESRQKITGLPAPHTDSIFAVIGEELGVIGAAFVVILFVAFAIRGFQIGRRAVDPFGALLAVGFTTWVIIRALLNIAVMTALVPSTGVPLPFISYGGSSLLVLLIGVGLMFSVQRVTSARQTMSDRRSTLANYDWGWGNRRARLSRTGRRRSATPTRSRRG